MGEFLLAYEAARHTHRHGSTARGYDHAYARMATASHGAATRVYHEAHEEPVTGIHVSYFGFSTFAAHFSAH